jgi:hypothetical protein
MSDLLSSLLIFTIIKTILSTFLFTVSNFYKNLVKWASVTAICIPYFFWKRKVNGVKPYEDPEKWKKPVAVTS